MNRILIGVAALALAGAYVASADTVVMQDGRRIRGELISVNRGTVLFDEIREGTTSKHRLRLNKDDVARIVLGENASGGGEQGAVDDGPFGPARDDGRDTRTGTGRVGRAGRPGRPAPPAADPDAEADGPFGPDRDTERDTEPPDLDADRGPSGHNRLISVPARQPWTDTGVDVAIGDVIRFTAEGTVAWSAGQEDGPAGEMNSPINDRRPIPARPAGALIGRIGTSPSDVFFIGDDRGGFRVRTSGRLYLGVNDYSYADNTGSFQVHVVR